MIIEWLTGLSGTGRQTLSHSMAERPVIEDTPDITRGLEVVIALGSLYGIDMGDSYLIRQSAE